MNKDTKAHVLTESSSSQRFLQPQEKLPTTATLFLISSVNFQQILQYLYMLKGIQYDPRTGKYTVYIQFLASRFFNFFSSDLNEKFSYP